MKHRTQRRHSIVSRAAGCELLERRTLLSLAVAGGEFRVNTFTTSDQSIPVVAADADGDFVVVWDSFAQDGSGRGIYAQRYSAAGVAQGGEFRVNTFTAGDQRFPAVAMDADGDFVIAWDSPLDGSVTGVYARLFNAAGVPQGGEFRVNTITTGEQSLPAVACSAGGDFVVTWKGDGPGDSYGVYARRYNALAVAQGAEFLANTFTTNTQRDPNVAMSADGDFVIAWTSSAQDPDGSSGAYAQRFDAGGTPQGGEFRVNGTTTGTQRSPAVAMDADGDFAVAWTSAYQIFAQRYDAAGVAQGVEFRADTSSGLKDGAAAAMDATGKFLITWTDGAFGSGNDGSGSGVFARNYNASGVAPGNEFRVNTFTTSNQSIPSAAMNADGDAIVVWQSNSQDGPSSLNGVYGQRYDESNPDTAPPVVGGVYRSGNLVLSYSTHEPVLSQLAVSFSEDMSVAGGTTGPGSVTNSGNWLITHNGTAVAPLLVTYGFNGATRRFEALLGLANPIIDGNFLVKARDTLRDLAGNRLDGNLDELAGGVFTLPFSLKSFGRRGGESHVNTFTPADQSDPAVATDAAGNVIVVWTSDGQDGSLRGIYGQRFDSGGVPLGDEFRVNTFTAGHQVTPAAAMSPDGDGVVVWASRDQDGSGYGTYAQRYNAAGAAQGAEFRVNTTTLNSQWMPTVAMDPSGNFVVAWGGEVQVGDNHIFAQRFNAAGAKVGGEIPVNGSTSDSPAIATDAQGNFVITWTVRNQGPISVADIQVRRFNAAGVPLSAELRVNSFTTGFQGLSSVARDAAGNFVVTWQSDDQDGSGRGVYAQRFSASGLGQGGEFRVNNHTTDNQTNTDVAMDPSGNFVVSWSTWQQDGSGYGVYAKRYNAAGAAQTTEFLVNTYTPGLQGDSEVAIDATGSFVITWAGDHQTDDFGIFAQRYGISRTPRVGALADTPDPVTAGGSITLGASDVVSADGTASSVSFYRESNGHGGLQVGAEGDTLVGTASAAVGGVWSVNVSTAGLPAGTHTYWAQATDDAALVGAPASTTNTVTTIAPAVMASTFVFQTAPHRLTFAFNQNVGASLGTDDIVLENLTTSQTIPASDLALAYNAATNTATFSYTGNAGGFTGVLPDGNYRATLLAAGITNPDGVPLAANHAFEFFFLEGDANHDGWVNLNDFNILAANFGQSGRDFTQADFDYDGVVNLNDFNILASRFGRVLAPGATGARDTDAFAGGRRTIDELRDLLR